MSPAERTALWRKANSYTRAPDLQRSIIEGWTSETCPYYFHKNSWTVRSKESHRPQNQVIVRGIRLDPASVKWYLLKGEYLPREALIYRPRIKYINKKKLPVSDLE